MPITPKTGSLFGSDSLSMQLALSRREKASTEQIKFGASIHLAFDELELGDLAFGLPIGPRLGHRLGNSTLIGDYTFAEGREDTALSSGDPRGQSSRITVAHHPLEALDQVA